MTVGWIVIGLAGSAVWLIKQSGTFMVAGLAIFIAAYYYWRRERLYHAMDRLGPAARRRSLAKQLRLSVNMTAQLSLFPTSALRGYALGHVLTKLL